MIKIEVDKVEGEGVGREGSFRVIWAAHFHLPPTESEFQEQG